MRNIISITNEKTVGRVKILRWCYRDLFIFHICLQSRNLNLYCTVLYCTVEFPDLLNVEQRTLLLSKVIK